MRPLPDKTTLDIFELKLLNDLSFDKYIERVELEVILEYFFLPLNLFRIFTNSSLLTKSLFILPTIHSSS